MHYSGSHRASNNVSRNHTAHFFRFAKSAKFTTGPRLQAVKDRIDIVCNCETINVPGWALTDGLVLLYVYKHNYSLGRSPGSGPGKLEAERHPVTRTSTT